MKKLAKIYFSEDITSAIFALVIFALAITMIVCHIVLGIRGVGLILELMLGACAWGLVCAVYKENKDDAAGHSDE